MSRSACSSSNSSSMRRSCLCAFNFRSLACANRDLDDEDVVDADLTLSPIELWAHSSSDSIADLHCEYLSLNSSKFFKPVPKLSSYDSFSSGWQHLRTSSCTSRNFPKSPTSLSLSAVTDSAFSCELICTSNSLYVFVSSA
ncbi:hypothetical protein DPMN_110845 [Dreissena polymorpha]|uniref:Uncharacterized protein n=1 Tax=Dreissena polymorpha TaxID=45954 RepID=A0A9D4KCR7_DREPO|nr:hypothetical protein DPMN_110845 [Dreissena polymorpha]